ncbi:hypothetical protein AX14_001019 [Amanita brunnescens Koide BX004]|nr:hypothetical protein AX14_001019 [Amanita brunnescens Koide BX004]
MRSLILLLLFPVSVATLPVLPPEQIARGAEFVGHRYREKAKGFNPDWRRNSRGYPSDGWGLDNGNYGCTHSSSGVLNSFGENWTKLAPEIFPVGGESSRGNTCGAARKA